MEHANLGSRVFFAISNVVYSQNNKSSRYTAGTGYIVAAYRPLHGATREFVHVFVFFKMQGVE